MGVLESLTGIRLFDALYTVSRFVLNEKQFRLGLLRATTTMELPVFYGNMCILVLPLILYLYEIYRQKKYLISMGLCMLALIHSGSRADAIFLFIVLAVFVVYVLTEKYRRVEFCKQLAAVMFSVFVFTSVLSIVNPYYRYFYTGSVKSVLNEVGFDFDLNEGAPDENIEFGKNPSGSNSRIQQFTGLLYTARVSPIFGLGSGAQTRREIHYFTRGEWRRWHTYDLGIVEIFGDEGILGLTGVILMLLVLIIADPKNRYMQMMCLAYILTTLNTKTMYSFLLIYVMLAVYNDHRLSK
jgi:O-antigen ligase